MGERVRPVSYWLFIFLLGGLFDFPLALGETLPGGTQAQRRPFILQLQGDRLSAHIVQVPLQSVLEMFAEETKIEIVVNRPLTYSTISVSFSGLPIEEAVKKLLCEEDYVAFYGWQGGRLELQKIWVLARDRDQERHAGEMENVNILLKRSADPDPDTRRQVLGALIESRDQRAVDALVSTVVYDEDEGVRQSAAFRLVEIEGERAAAPLLAALRDASPVMRSVFVMALGRLGPRALPALEAALTDFDPAVREVAASLIEKFQDEEALGF